MSVTLPRIYNVKTNLPVSALYHLPTAPLAPPDSSHGGPWSAVEDPNSGSAHRYCAAAWKPGLRRGAGLAPAAVSVGARHHSEPQNGVNVAAGTTARKSAQVCVGARDSWDPVPDPLLRGGMYECIYMAVGRGRWSSSVPSGIQARDIHNTQHPTFTNQQLETRSTRKQV